MTGGRRVQQKYAPRATTSELPVPPEFLFLCEEADRLNIGFSVEGPIQVHTQMRSGVEAGVGIVRCS